MDYRLKQGESVPEGTRRMAAEQLDRALEYLGCQDGERDKHVHEARKATKRLRALVRLVRRDLGDEVYALENQCYRAAGQRLSGLRDATVLVETLDRLVESLGKDVPKSRFARVRRWLVERRDLVYGQVDSSNRAVQEAIVALAQARERLEHWNLQRRGWGGIRVGVQRIYARGRRDFAGAYALPSDEAFHDWRKQVKYLWYHAQILEPIWPPVMQTLAKELDQLGELLGQDHDLAVLRTTVMVEFPRAGATATLMALERRIGEVRSRMQGQARLLGERIYLERPREFSRRLRGYWRVWQVEQDGVPANGE
ncbi:MAG: CHAD domain-containing protein [Gemmatimonadetes bacterium]|nr:CHAD domain-containing protein [Gemmatimonadota bacterium]MYC72811.1 CHAD domain-containing protein [Gemmatimonadota bacterium]